MKKLFYLGFLSFIFSQTSHAQTKYLWATATQGGAMGYGSILQGDSNGANFHIVHSFDRVNGNNPVGKMAMADNGKIYLATVLGGYGDSCTICTYDPVTQILTKIYDFDSLTQFGFIPQAGVIRARDGKIYGMAQGGGMYGNGVIYMVDPADDSYHDIYDFTGHGGASFTELVESSDGQLYGMTQGGYDTTELFSFNPVQGTYRSLHYFTAGYGLYSSTTLYEASDHKLYGVVESYNKDTVTLFSFDPHLGIYTDLRTMPAAQGIYPQSGLVQASDGKLYGIGSATPTGVPEIYSYDISTGVYQSVFTLDVLTGFVAARNMGKLANGKLVFSTQDGGPNGGGALVSFDISTGHYTILFSGESSTGMMLSCDILEASIGNVTGIAAIPDMKVSLYPNPASSSVYVSNTKPETTYTVTNVIGEQLMTIQATGNTQAIDISALPRGMYFIDKVKFVKE